MCTCVSLGGKSRWISLLVASDAASFEGNWHGEMTWWTGLEDQLCFDWSMLADYVYNPPVFQKFI